MEYIDIYQAMRYVLPFVSLMKEIELVFKIQGDTPEVFCSISKNPVTFYEENQGAVALAVSPKMRARTKHIKIKYYHF